MFGTGAPQSTVLIVISDSVYIIASSPLHFVPFESGSHSPLPIQVDVLDPVSISPGGQLKVTVVPSVGGFLSLSTSSGLSD